MAYIFPSHKYTYAGKKLDTIQSMFCCTGWAECTPWIHTALECSAQCFHLLSTTLHLERSKRHVTNPAPGKSTNFQSLLKVSRQKLRLFWEAICTGTLSCMLYVCLFNFTVPFRCLNLGVCSQKAFKALVWCCCPRSWQRCVTARTAALCSTTPLSYHTVPLTFALLLPNKAHT